jgi:transcriptional regulator with XRE-family HTH domain
MKVGYSIRKFREFKGFKQETIAEHLKISQASYSKLENDEADITLTRLQDIADFLNISIEDIIAFDKKNFFYNSANSNNFNSTVNDFTLLDDIIKSKDKLIVSLEAQIALMIAMKK